MIKERFLVAKYKDLAWHLLCYISDRNESKKSFREAVMRHASDRVWGADALKLVRQIRTENGWCDMEVLEYREFSKENN